MQAMEEPAAAGHAFNVANLRPVTQLEAVEALAAVAQKTPQLVSMPRERIWRAGGNPMGPLIYFGVYFDLPPITQVVNKAQRMLGFQPTAFEGGLKEAYKWYLKHGSPRQADYTFEDSLLAGTGVS
jgi:nucleoside-diphosphate-sugar epimerase